MTSMTNRIVLFIVEHYPMFFATFIFSWMMKLLFNITKAAPKPAGIPPSE